MADPSGGGGGGGKRFSLSGSAGMDDSSGGVAVATTTAAGGTRGGGGGGARKRSRESSPVPPSSSSQDAHLQSAVAAAAQTCSNIGYHGLASLLTQSSPSSSSSSDGHSSSSFLNLLRPDPVQQAALKACTEVSPPWIHWNRSDMASTLRATGPHRLGLAPVSLRGYRMARASVGCSEGCYYYECWIQPGPTTSEILANLPSNARLGPGLQRNLQAALEYEQQQEKEKSSSASSILNTTSDEDAQRQRNKKKQSASEDSSQQRSAQPPPPPAPVGGHVRVGWSMRTGDLNAPVGYDKWSYGIRDTGGSIIHQSQRQDHWGGNVGFGAGDVVGCAVCLDPVDPLNKNHIRFFKNGDCMGEFVITKGKRSGGEAFTGAGIGGRVQSGTYYPACSSYLGGTIRANFGPKFVHLPRKLPPGLKLLPMSDLCKPPLDYDAALLQMASTLKLFRKPEHAQALQDAMKLEAHILTETYDNYMKQHYEDVRQARLERGLTVQDLPEIMTATAPAAAAATAATPTAAETNSS